MSPSIPTYPIDLELLNTILNDYCNELGSEYQTEYNDKNSSKIIITLSKGKKSERGILNIFVKAGGKCSFQVQGQKVFDQICQSLKDKIINESRIDISNKKSFSIKKVNEADYLTFIDFLKDEKYDIQSCTLTGLEKFKDKITSANKEVVTLTFYHTGTMLAQGSVSRLMLNLIAYATEVFSDNDVAKSRIDFFEIADAKVFDVKNELQTQFGDEYSKINEKILNSLTVSLELLNVTSATLPDYSAFAFPALRALEGALKKSLNVGARCSNDKVGDYFRIDGATDNYIANALNTTNGDYKRYTENGYNHYHKNRHSLFHFDNSIDTTTEIDYVKSKEIIEDVILIIFNMSKYW